MSSLLVSIIIFIVVVILISIKQINEYQRGAKFQFGRYVGIMGPGWKLVFPIIQSFQKFDIRIRAVNVPDQEVITQDNVSARINAVIYYNIADVEKAVLAVEDYYYAVLQLAQTTMRNVVGETSLDDLLAKRSDVAIKIQKIVDKAAEVWGIEVDTVELKDIVLPEEMKRVIAQQAEAERERRSIIIRAEGEKEASKNIAEAAKILASTMGGLHIRTLQTISELSGDKSNTVVFVTPVEVLRAFESFINKK